MSSQAIPCETHRKNAESARIFNLNGIYSISTYSEENHRVILTRERVSTVETCQIDTRMDVRTCWNIKIK